MSPSGGRCGPKHRPTIDREIDLDKLRAAIRGSGKANDFHQGSPNDAPLGAGVAARPRLQPGQLCHREGRKVDMKLGVALRCIDVAATPLQAWTEGNRMKISRKDFVTAIAVGAVFFLSSAVAPAQQSSAQISPEQIARIVAGPDRSEADRTNDLRRKPEQMLGFIGIRPGIVALDLSAAGGYTTELLARAIGPSGAVYGQSRPHGQTAAPPPAPEGNSNPSATPSAAPATPAPARRPSPVALAERDGKLRSAGVPASPIVAVSRPFEDPVPPELAAERIDLVTLMFNYHDLGHLGVDRAAMNQAVFRALKPGGLYVIADHSGRPGTDISESGTLHRIEEAFLRQEVEAAGFRLLELGNFLRNPNDPRDKNTPDPPQPKDEFVLKFAKP
jgi:predicted methyltransferase